MMTTQKIPFIAILRGIQPTEVCSHIEELIKAGFSMIEIPLNSPCWEESVHLAVEHFGEQALIGAGTVLSVADVEKVAALGGRLIVTPNTEPEVIKRSVELGMTIIPGCATATEAFTAIGAGAQGLKIFPSSTFGSEYIKALKTVFPPHINVLAVGGVTPENLSQYFQAGCSGMGLGGALYQAGQSPEKTKERAESFIASYNKRISKTV